jgi:hypothetical protein
MTGYINERLRIGGANGTPIFSPEAVEAIYKYSRGIPRVANLLCENSLINSFVDLVKPVPPSVVHEAAHEFELDELDPMARPVIRNGEDSSKTVEGLLRSLNHLLEEMGRNNSVTSGAHERKP